ncbi:MAG TPA: DUF4286 family protein [Puia sp.]|nr:DUF4286 family protein [Puia sp.]
MIVYNVTIKVNWKILEEWLAWVLEREIPAVLGSGLFESYRFFRLLEQDEEEGPTFVVQYFTLTLENYQQYMLEFAPARQEESRNKWGDGTIAFRTIMSLVEEG